MENELLAHPEIKVVFATLGPDGRVNKVNWRVVTSTKHERSETLAEEVEEVGRQAAQSSADRAHLRARIRAFVEGAGRPRRRS